jgi:uncharacterized protein (TIRG00374 family)
MEDSSWSAPAAGSHRRRGDGGKGAAPARVVLQPLPGTALPPAGAAPSPWVNALTAEQPTHEGVAMRKNTTRRLSLFRSILRNPLTRLGLRLLPLPALLALFLPLLTERQTTLLLSHLSYARLLSALLIGLLGVVLSAYQWRALLQAQRIHFDLAALIKLYMVGIAFNQLLPTGVGGDAVKAFYSARGSASYAAAIVALVLCRLTGLMSMCLLVGMTLALWGRWLPSTLVSWALLCCLPLGIILAGLISGGLLWAGKQRSQMERHLLRRDARFKAAFWRAFVSPSCLAQALGWGFCFWIVACVNYYGCALALGIQTPLPCYFVLVPLVSLATSLPLSINGLGLREGALIATCSLLGVPTGAALLLGCCLELQGLLFALIGGIGYLLMRRAEHVSGKR